MLYRGLFQISLFCSGILLFVAVVLSFLELTLRNLFYFSIVGIDQIITYIVIWSTFLGAGYAVAMNAHVRMDLLEQVVSPRAGLIISLMTWVLCVAFSVILIFSGIALVDESIKLKEMTIGVIRIPLWYIQSIMAISAMLFLIGSVVNTFQIATRLFGRGR